MQKAREVSAFTQPEPELDLSRNRIKQQFLLIHLSKLNIQQEQKQAVFRDL
jgi:hypothetical protein